MIFELPKHDFSLTKSLITERCNTEARSVIEGFNPGWVFVDNPKCPTSALVWSKGLNGFMLIGDEDNKDFNESLNQFVDVEIMPRAKILGYSGIEISGTTNKWDKTIQSVFKDRDLAQWTQFVYVFQGDSQVLQGPLAPLEPFHVISVTPEMLRTRAYTNIDFVSDTLLEFWDSLDAFFANGYAYCVTDGTYIASLCYTSFVASGIHELGIETVKDYRRRGFAKAAALECLRHTVHLGLPAYWDCTSTNDGSFKTAEGIGFARAWEYQCYAFKI